MAKPVGGTVKRETARESLRRPSEDQILNVPDMLHFCQEKIKAIEFMYVSKENVSEVRTLLQPRYANACTLPGTRRFRHFKPINNNEIQDKEISADD